MRVAVVALAALAFAAAPTAHANGRNPATSTIHFRAGSDGDVAAGMTFGLIVSHDGGATWDWICEDAIGYGGIYDPVYVYTSAGSLFATTFNGLRVSRDGCTFDPIAAGTSFASTDALGPDGAYYYGASDPTDGNIYKSVDDGVTFGSGVTPPGGQPSDWWQSIAIAPSDAARVYLAGFRSGSNGERVLDTYESIDGGSSYASLPVTDFTTSSGSVVEILAVDPTTEDTLYAHVTQQDGMLQHGVYRSTDAGQHWASIFTISDAAFAFALRGNGDLVVGTQFAGVWVSHDQGAHWSQITTAPHVNCLAENAHGELWACTQNYAVQGAPPSDGAGIMKTTDGSSWTKVMAYQDLVAPVGCGSGTIQHDSCQVQEWCALKMQLGITSTALACATASETPPGLDAPVLRPHTGGCCDSGGSGDAETAMLAMIALCAGRSARARRRWRAR